MSASLVILCLAIVALVAFCVSAATSAALWALRRQIDRLAPSAQARIVFVASLLPLFSSIVVLVVSLAPSFGWIADHCGVIGVSHSHPHVCAEHHRGAWPALPLIGLAGFIAIRCLAAFGRRLFALALSRRKIRSLLSSSVASDVPGVRVLPLAAEAQAFILGLLRPTLFVTEALATGAERNHLDAVVAHERAHIRRRDPLRRFVAGLGLAFHLPGVARWLDAALSRAQEMAADREAANLVGAAGVARALVALAKSKLRVPRSALAFAGGSIEARVRLVMDDRARRDWPALSAVIAGAALAVLVAVSSAEAVHHGVEILIGALGG